MRILDKLFAGDRVRDRLEFYLRSMEIDIAKKGAEYLMGVDLQEYYKCVYEENYLIPLTIYEDRVATEYEHRSFNLTDEIMESHEYQFQLKIPFTGHKILLELKPTQHMLRYEYAKIIHEKTSGQIIYAFSLRTEDDKAFENEQKGFIDYLNINIANINQDVVWYNNELKVRFDRKVAEIISRRKRELEFLKRINVNINKETLEVFQIPKVDQMVILEPVLSADHAGAQISTIPTVSMEFYNDVCNIINQVYRSVEKKPSIYKSRNEEELRDYILPVLETRYESVTATGETFNNKGKTDILVRYKDGTNLFIAECKFWPSPKKAGDSITQLFDRYLTWRDTKVAMIFFVKGKRMTEIVRKIDDVIRNHPYFVAFDKVIDQTTSQYKMHIPGDTNQEVLMRALAFAFNN